MLNSIISHYRTWKHRKAMRRELLRLTDRELADIGINRGDIDQIVSQETDRRQVR
jgi:uncharacterized protein YjiS (DUF1127 family)